MVLLHAGDVALRATRFDWPVVALGALALALSLARAWAPGTLAPAVRRSLRRAGPHAVAIAVALAVLPSAFPYDHLLVSESHGGREAEVHATHCHTSPGSCSDVPVPSGPGQLFDTAPLVVVPAMLAFLIATAVPAMGGISWKPEVPPPLFLHAA